MNHCANCGFSLSWNTPNNNTQEEKERRANATMGYNDAKTTNFLLHNIVGGRRNVPKHTDTNLHRHIAYTFKRTQNLVGTHYI